MPKKNIEIVINSKFGGFNISVEALKMLVIRKAKCLETMTPKHYYGGENPNFKNRPWEPEWERDFAEYKDLGDGILGHKYGHNVFKDGLLYLLKSGDETRTDKDLIAVVRQLKSKADGFCAKLKIVKIPANVEWEINEYDGLESVREKHRSWA